MNYHDEYLTTLWTNELRGQVEAAASGAPGNVFEFSFDVSLAGNRRSRAEFYQAIWGTVPRYSDLPAEHKKRLWYSAEVKVLGSVDSGNITAHAGTMMDIKQAMNPQDESFSTGVKYKVYRNRNDTTPGWEYYGRPSDLVSVERILPHFIGWGDRTGKYYNVNTGQFDLSHPLQ